MRNWILISFGIILSIGCGASYSVFHDANPDANFATVKTYRIVFAGEKAMRSELARKSIEAAIHELMMNRGFEHSADAPDIVLAYDGRVRQKKQVVSNQDPMVYGPRWGYYGWDSYEYRTYDVTEGTLVIDFVAAGTNELLWQGGVVANVDPTTITSEEAKKAVRLIFTKFPYVAESNQRISAAKAKGLSTYKEDVGNKNGR